MKQTNTPQHSNFTIRHTSSSFGIAGTLQLNMFVPSYPAYVTAYQFQAPHPRSTPHFAPSCSSPLANTTSTTTTTTTPHNQHPSQQNTITIRTNNGGNPRRSSGLSLPALRNHHSRRQRRDAPRGQKAPEALCRPARYARHRCKCLGHRPDFTPARIRSRLSDLRWRGFRDPSSASCSWCSRRDYSGKAEMDSARHRRWLERPDRVTAGPLGQPVRSREKSQKGKPRTWREGEKGDLRRGKRCDQGGSSEGTQVRPASGIID